MSRSCVCSGSNENCRFCNGLGTIKDNLASALVDHAQRTDLRKDTEAYRVSSGVGRFISTRIQRAAAFLKGQEQLVPCPIPGCLVRLKSNRVERHLKRAHDKPQPVALQPSAIPNSGEIKHEPKPKVAQQLVPCPISGCKAKLKPGRVNHHMRKVHNVRFSSRARNITLRTGSVETRSAEAAKYMVSNSIPDGSPRVSLFGQAPEKNLDATKGYAHAYRENGRFGSHPSHDGFDGEAGPD